MRNEWLEGGEFEMMVLSKVRQDPGPVVYLDYQRMVLEDPVTSEPPFFLPSF